MLMCVPTTTSTRVYVFPEETRQATFDKAYVLYPSPFSSPTVAMLFINKLKR